ncbi:MAG: hypothetical protein ABWY11_06620 [Umezawaea sp.]
MSTFSCTDAVRLMGAKEHRLVAALPKVPTELIGLATSPVPLVTPEQPYEDNLLALSTYYSGLASGLGSFLSGLAVWDSMDDRQRGRPAELPEMACRRYEEDIRRLAVDCPEPDLVKRAVTVAREQGWEAWLLPGAGSCRSG